MPKSKYKKDKEMYMSGGSIMVPTEREEYWVGALAKGGKSVVDFLKQNKLASARTVAATAVGATLVIESDEEKAWRKKYKNMTLEEYEEFYQNSLSEEERKARIEELKASKEKNDKLKKIVKNLFTREGKAEGGSLMMPPEMAAEPEPEMEMDMPIEEEEESIEEPVMDIPEDTYQSEDPR